MIEATHDGALLVGPMEIRFMGQGGVCSEYRGHEHDYDHWTFCFKGRIRINVLADDGTVEREQIIEEGQGFYVKRDVRHNIKDLAGGSIWLCLRERKPEGVAGEVYSGREAVA